MDLAAKKNGLNGTGTLDLVSRILRQTWEGERVIDLEYEGRRAQTR